MSESNAVALSRAEATGRRLIELLVNGLDKPSPAVPAKPVHQPLTLLQASWVLRMRVPYLKRVLDLPEIQAAYAAAIAARRGHAAPRAIATIESIMDEQGENTPADRGVRLKAAGMILGDARPAQLNVQVNQIRPGYVLLPPGEDQP